MTGTIEKEELRKEMALLAIQHGASVEETDRLYRWVLDGTVLTESVKREDERLNQPVGKLLQHVKQLNHGTESQLKSKGVNTVGDLVDFGFCNFTKLFNVGRKSAVQIDNLLEQSYGIKDWYLT